MFGRLFGRKSVKTIEQPVDEMEFLGNVQGTGVNSLRIALAIRLRSVSGVANAYLAQVQYSGEDKPRIGFAIDAPLISEAQKKDIAAQCSGVLPMDIFFLDSEPESKATALRNDCTPLFLPDLKLFECPIRVARGSNSEMPAEWKGAIIVFFVAAATYQEALLVAVGQLRAEGYEFLTVENGIVNQLDPSLWWSAYVMEKWSTYASHFPTQSEIEAIVATGGYFKGPALESES